MTYALVFSGIGGPEVAATMLGWDIGDGVTGGGIHGKDLSKADVSVNIWCYLESIRTCHQVTACCSIGDESVGGVPYAEIVEKARYNPRGWLLLVSVKGLRERAFVGTVTLHYRQLQPRRRNRDTIRLTQILRRYGESET